MAVVGALCLIVAGAVVVLLLVCGAFVVGGDIGFFFFLAYRRPLRFFALTVTGVVLAAVVGVAGGRVAVGFLLPTAMLE